MPIRGFFDTGSSYRFDLPLEAPLHVHIYSMLPDSRMLYLGDALL